MSKFAYMNFNPYTVLIHLNNGIPLAVPQNNGVKGEFFAKFAVPVGPLTEVHADRVIKSHIIRTIEEGEDVQPIKVVREKAVVAPVVMENTAPVREPAPAPVELPVEPVEEEDDFSDGTAPVREPEPHPVPVEEPVAEVVAEKKQFVKRKNRR
jgi:hypothetical protein